MKKDIETPAVSNVHIVIAKAGKGDWSIFLLNRTGKNLQDALMVSMGHGIREDKEVKTSTLRHYLREVPAHGFSFVERIDPELFNINNEFWLTYYCEGQMFDEKFLFSAGTISEKNLSYIKELKMNGVL